MRVRVVWLTPIPPSGRFWRNSARIVRLFGRARCAPDVLRARTHRALYVCITRPPLSQAADDARLGTHRPPCELNTHCCASPAVSDRLCVLADENQRTPVCVCVYMVTGTASL